VENREIIQNATQAELSSSGDHAKATRLAQQLIVSSPEFHSTNIVRKRANITREVPVEDAPSNEPYKAVVYLMFGGGQDSYNLLVPKGGDMYQGYKDIRGSRALEPDKLLDIDATGSNQPCDTFAVNSAIPVLQKLYGEGDALFLANTGVLQKLVTKTDWQGETKTRLFSHNSQQRETCKLDIAQETGETGVAGRMIDVLKRNGLATSSATVAVDTMLLAGDPFKNHPVTELPWSLPKLFNRGPSSENMQEVILDLNGATKMDSGLFGETWASKLYQALAENSQQAHIYENYPVDTDFPSGGMGNNFKSASQWIKSRDERGVQREVFYIQHGGYDHHSDPETNLLEDKLTEANDALEAFVAEMKLQNIWDNIVIVTGSDFARTLTPNSGDGTDHGWGGNYFMMGGNLKGSRILGSYPDDLTEEGPVNIGRGRLIPTLPWEAAWKGIAQWMGVANTCDLDYVLPNRGNFDECLLFTDRDLFKDGSFDHSSCSTATCDGPTTPPTPCMDSSSWFVKKRGKKKRCNWVAKNRKRCGIIGKGKKRASDACQVACGKCPAGPTPAPAPAPPPASCVDSSTWFAKIKGKKKRCNWVAKNRNRCGKVGKGKIRASDACPVACGNCPA
jgi:uncharacterized protein (DUF1501 family)